MSARAARLFSIAALASLSSLTALAGCTPSRTGEAGADGAPSSAPAASSSATADAGQVSASAGSPSAEAGPAPGATERGRLLYERYCDFCHGDHGQGYKADQAPALASDDLLALASDDFLRDAIVKGRPGTTMSSWAVARGGPLSYADAQAIVSYLRTWQKRPSESTEARVVEGVAARGATTYAAHCASCHGAKGRDGKYNALANPELLASASDGFLAATIERGRAGTPMTGFAGKLSPQAVNDVVALLRSWQRPPEEVGELPPKPGELTSVVANPRGRQPSFDAKADFIKVDEVKAALDRNASLVIIDAHPPSDYARMHIAGAISVPFYQVTEYAKQLPRERFILTYCACPHAESMKVQGALRALGYPRVAVIDEGLLVWRDRGYPVRGGPRP